MKKNYDIMTKTLLKANALSSQWNCNSSLISEDALIETLVKRWFDNDPTVEPAGMEVFPEFENWYDALELYLLATDEAPLFSDILARSHIEALAEFRKSARDANLLEFGDLWFYDITSLVRYRGSLTQDVLCLLRTAANHAAEAIPHTDDDSLRYFSDLYLRAAETFVIGVSEKSLQNTAVRTGLAKIPFQAFHIIRDAFPSGGVHHIPTIDEARDRFLFIFDITLPIFEKLKLFYREPASSNNEVSFRFGKWAKSFDYPTALFSGALPWEFADEAERMIDGIVINARKEKRVVVRNGWQPAALRMRDQLSDIWQLNASTDQELSQELRTPTSDELVEKAAAEAELERIFEDDDLLEDVA